MNSSTTGPNGRAGKAGLLKRLRSTTAVTAAKLATKASRATGRGAGGMIGGLIAGAIDPGILERLGGGRPAVLVTGTNGKSTTCLLYTSDAADDCCRV